MIFTTDTILLAGIISCIILLCFERIIKMIKGRKRVFYFAYSEDMCNDYINNLLFRRTSPGEDHNIFYSKAWLQDWAFCFLMKQRSSVTNGATLISSPSVVHGVLYTIRKKDFNRLLSKRPDCKKKMVKVFTQTYKQEGVTDEAIEAFTLVASTLEQVRPPSQEDTKKILRGAIERGLPKYYIDSLTRICTIQQ